MNLANALMLSLEDVDWSRTVAFSKGNYGQIFINLKGRETSGIVQPGAEYESVMKRVIDKLSSLVDPDTNQRLIGPVFAGRYDQQAARHA
jgi:predicted AlkP superfamily phosphohydrolase/phosphomutase